MTTTKRAIVEQTTKFIASVELPPLDTTQPYRYNPDASVFQDDASGAAVNAGSLVSFVSGLTAQHKSDVLNSTLFAQLAANKQYDRYKQTQKWYDSYVSVLAQVGWVVPAFAYREYTPSGGSFTVDAAVLDILAAIATGDEMKILQTALGGLKDNTKNEHALTLFDQQSFPEKLGTFQIFPVGEDDGQLVMALAAMEFKAVKHVTRFLWFTWTSTETQLFQSSQKGVLNEDVYGPVRKVIIDKLGDRAKQFIIDIEI